MRTIVASVFVLFCIGCNSRPEPQLQMAEGVIAKLQEQHSRQIEILKQDPRVREAVGEFEKYSIDPNPNFRRAIIGLDVIQDTILKVSGSKGVAHFVVDDNGQVLQKLEEITDEQIEANTATDEEFSEAFK